MSAMRAAPKAAEIGSQDEETSFSLIRAAAKYVAGVKSARARIRELRR